MTKITQKTLESLRLDRSGSVIRDEGNLFGRIRAKADDTVAVSFYYRYRFDGKFKDISCGTWPAVSLSQIRANRDAAKLRVTEGVDPVAKKKVEKQEQREAIAVRLAEIEHGKAEGLTVQDMFDAWIADGVRRKDGNAELRRSFNADALPKIGRKEVRALTEHDLRGVLRAMVVRGVNRAAVAMRNNLMQMFAWAEKRQPWRKLFADGNPMELIEIDKIVSPDYDLNNQRDRTLSTEEIRELRDIFRRMHAEYEQADNKRTAVQPLERVVQCAIWIMLSTLCRVGELSMARWEHLNLESGAWFIPRENVKDNASDLTVYLSDFTIERFRQLHKITGKSEWCFPARNKEGYVNVKSMSKQIGDRQTMFKKSLDGGPRKPMKNRRNDNTLVLASGKKGAWTPHDLRRTGATMMQSLGVSMDMIDRCQNHVLAGSKVRRHYLHHDYASEKREAWARLGGQLSAILAAPENVVPFQRKA
ncbi:site-specific integrase [Noviherbaspirillum cavernae]|uniref:Site-specific integrase n=1 Tax=Noviherbaspirillum cavernae TaxID=2320862 RepID=A0A418X070_9BURK|nr:site-specific integrase [Noviherbaspirillum cavernae]RJG05842.1 site-specific integrase [Noviherbaspirillum cavernae]